MLGVTISPNVRVTVDPVGAEHQAEAHRIAMAVVDSAETLRLVDDALSRERQALDAAKAAEQSRQRAYGEMNKMLSARTACWVSDLFAREDPRTGEVSLGSESDWTRHFALLFRSWAHMRRAHPSLAPAGVIIDPDGRPAVRMRETPVTEADR